MHVDSIRSQLLLSGITGTHQTLREMAALVREDCKSLSLRQKALEIVAGCGGHQFECEIRALFHYCRDEIIYRRDPIEGEWVQDAQRTIFVFGSGDCDDKVVCLATLLGAIGHRSRFVVVGKKPEQYTHVFLEVRTRRGWFPLDPTPEHAPFGWEARGLHRATYEIWGNSSTGGVWCVLALGALAAWLLKGN